MACSLETEDVFGPQVNRCGTDFDFTLLFEETILTILPLCITLCLALFRIYTSYRKPCVVSSRLLHGAKITGHCLITLLSIAFLVVEVAAKTSLTRTTIAAAVVGLLGSIVLTALSHLDHYRSVRCSTLLLLYYAVSALLDSVRARTLWSMPNNHAVASVFTAITAMKFVILLLEKKSKTVNEGIHASRDEKADVYEQAFITWMLPVFVQGFKRPLTMDMLPDIEAKLKTAQHTQTVNDRPHRERPLLIELFEGRRSLFLGAIIPRLCNSGFTYAQPFLIATATTYMSEPLNENTYPVGGGLVAAFFLVYVGMGISQLVYRQYTVRLTAGVRVDLVAKIYQHSLMLNQEAASKTSVATLMSNDVERVTTGLRNLHEAWGGLIDLALAFYLLVRQLDYAVAPVGGLTLVCILIPVALSSTAGTRQAQWMRAIDDRIDVTVDALKALKSLKMTGIGDKARKRLQELRHTEVRKSWDFRIILGIISVSAWLALIGSPIVGFSVYILVVAPGKGQFLLFDKAYSSLTLFALLGFSTAQFIDGVYGLSVAFGCCERIKNGLVSSGYIDPLARAPRPSQIRIDEAATASEKRVAFERPLDSIAVKLDQVNARWQSNDRDIINNVSLTIQHPSIVTILGPTGCGKSSLLSLILGELKRSAGEVVLSAHRVGYCGQTPWLTNETIKENILGCEEYEREWYSEVLALTDLEADISRLKNSDSTMIGSNGVQLSGGQRKRIGIARAIYSRAPLIIIDEPFAGLDAHTESKLLESLFGQHGIVRRQNRTAILATSYARQLTLMDKVFVMTTDGQVMETPAKTVVDKIVELRTANSQPYNQDETTKVMHQHQQWAVEARQPVPSKHGEKPSDFLYYVRVVGLWRFLVFVFLSMIFVLGLLFPQVWLNWWATDVILNPGARRGYYYAGIYLALGVLGVVGFVAAVTVYIVTIAEKSAYVLHETILDTVLRAPLSFSDTTDIGDIVNRFSQDLQLIDMELPLGMILTATSVLLITGQCVIITWASNWSGIAIPPLLIAICILLPIYLRTSGALRLLDIQAKAPVFSHFLETLSGLSTIRAFGWTESHLQKNASVSSDSQRPFFLFLSGQNWLILTLSCITTGLATVVMAIGVATKQSSFNSTIGLALFNVAAFSNTSKDLVYVWAQMEVCLGAAGRIRDFSKNVVLEDSNGAQHPPTEWPKNGFIEFRKVSFCYSPTSPLVLQDVSFSIKPGQNFGVCGRTGSGKSTLLSALLRAISLDHGTIFIDNIDIATLDRTKLRTSLNVLPQEPLIILGSIRENMQLFGDHNDAALIAALETFGLWSVVERKGGLDAKMNAEILSHGQRQLFAFARATLHTSKILILDEPSSQLDRATELRIKAAIEEQFSQHTILCIAHRLDTIAAFDNVVVIEAGSIVEMGNPQELLQDESSAFATLLARQTEEQNVWTQESI